MRQVRTHRFNGVKYFVDIEAINGWCDKPDKPAKNEYPSIRIPNGLPYGDSKEAKEGLIALIHEVGHAQKWGTPENVVDRRANELGNLLWRLGYRRKK